MGAFQSVQIHPHLVKLLPAGFKREGESATHEAGPLCPVMSLYLRPFPPTRPSSRAAFVARSTHVWLCPLLCCLPHKLVSLLCFPVKSCRTNGAARQKLGRCPGRPVSATIRSCEMRPDLPHLPVKPLRICESPADQQRWIYLLAEILILVVQRLVVNFDTQA